MSTNNPSNLVIRSKPMSAQAIQALGLSCLDGRTYMYSHVELGSPVWLSLVLVSAYHGAGSGLNLTSSLIHPTGLWCIWWSKSWTTNANTLKSHHNRCLKQCKYVLKHRQPYILKELKRGLQTMYRPLPYATPPLVQKTVLTPAPLTY